MRIHSLTLRFNPETRSPKPLLLVDHCRNEDSLADDQVPGKSNFSQNLATKMTTQFGLYACSWRSTADMRIYSLTLRFRRSLISSTKMTTQFGLTGKIKIYV